MSTQLSEILQLTIAERIQLAADIWDSVAAFPEAILLYGRAERRT
jgi:putative addiction module component (TIGR02574 family)